MSRPRTARIPFVRFCEDVLHLPLTVPWRVLLAVTIDGAQPRALVGEEREAARVLFGDVEEIDPALRRVIGWRLGRASGKTTIAAAVAIYCAWTCPLPRKGHGHVPAAFIVSEAHKLAKIGQGVARELVRGSDLERYVLDDTAEGFILRRPDGRSVEIASVAASKGGANLRGRDVVVLIVDESEFMGSEDGGYSVTDRDQVSAVMPRLLGYVLLISTLWPTENFTAESFDRNFGHPVDAVAALGTSMFMRPSERLARDIEMETARDPENADREYRCIAGPRGGSRLFVEGLPEAVVEGRPLAIRAAAGVRVGCGGDLGLERDSSAIAVASGSREGLFELLEFDEVRPAKGAPLAPGYVIRERFAPVMQRHGVRTVWMDSHYRQSAREHLSALGLAMGDAPCGSDGKYDVYMFTRGLLRAGQLRLPPSPRLLAQLRAITATPLPLGGTRITSPRRAGVSGHGDIVSAAVLAIWAANHSRPQRLPGARPQQGVVGLLTGTLHGGSTGEPIPSLFGSSAGDSHPDSYISPTGHRIPARARYGGGGLGGGGGSSTGDF